MRVRRIAVQNVRSFLDRQEVSLDGNISIFIGPNGGGKTNLLDILVTMLRKFVIRSPYFVNSPLADQAERWVEHQNDHLNQLTLEPHSSGRGISQIVELDLEVTETDMINMRRIVQEAEEIKAALKRVFMVDPWERVKSWQVDSVLVGGTITVCWVNGSIQPLGVPWKETYLDYLRFFETDNSFRAEVGADTLRLPLIYLPVSRASSGFSSTVGLSGFNDTEYKRGTDAVSSRSGSNFIPLAIGRIAKKYRLMQEESNVDVKDKFYADPNLVELTNSLNELGYTWRLETVDALSNTYDIKLTKQGSSFLVGAASSGERELLTYLFAIHALNVRNALIVIDEPELHLHPRWQTALLSLFERLAASTGNQFVLTTHSPTFISPSSIQYVSRVFSEKQNSRVQRLDARSLPNSKHLFSIVNTQNNERIFFSDKVVLVEGLSDRIVFERVLNDTAERLSIRVPQNIEIVSVGGKGLFPAYQKLLSACSIQSFVIADRDYVEQIGAASVKGLFKVDAEDIRSSIKDVSSRDAETLVSEIDRAMESGSWETAREVWAYMKSRRKRLVDELTEEQQQLLSDFVDERRAENVFVLKHGSLEDYLPDDVRKKDMEKLITFITSPSFWKDIPEHASTEFSEIAEHILRS